MLYLEKYIFIGVKKLKHNMFGSNMKSAALKVVTKQDFSCLIRKCSALVSSFGSVRFIKKYICSCFKTYV